jgi:hypothetical protein
MFQPLHVFIKPVARLAKRFMNDKLELKVRGATGLVPISQFDEEDVFIVGSITNAMGPLCFSNHTISPFHNTDALYTFSGTEGM